MPPLLIIILVLFGIYVILRIVALIFNEPKSINNDNQYINCKNDNCLVKSSKTKKRFYEVVTKRIIDSTLSFFGLIILSPLFLAIAIWVKADDPGPVFFEQKRVGKNKEYFFLHKFRSMKMSTPHDMPTHMLDNPDLHITKSGSFLRKSSLDELPQIWDIFRGKMSIVGPRPALWNQSDLIAEREKYNANTFAPGLTGLAQINGRDELDIASKAKLDGDYCNNISFGMDLKCFFGTFKKVIKGEGVVEGNIVKQKHEGDTR